ncbi:MAG: hypothetical protein IKS94_01035 [Prevotella sp.]|nr:hypothetical protein [Muribaculaceae bacterium]MBR6445008.1 hypothetical protein [Prevotella sp.]
MKKKESRFIPMPSIFFDERRESETRDKVVRLLSAVQTKIKKFRENGVTIADEVELKALTPEAVKAQIEEVKQRRLGERFLPPSIRNQETAAFARMEAILVKEAEDLQELLKSVPFPILVAENAEETTFDGAAAEAYIEQASNVPIPPIVQDYYAQLIKVCEAWDAFADWCAKNNLQPPTRRVLNMIAGSGAPDEAAILNIAPDQMFTYWKFGNMNHLS